MTTDAVTRFPEDPVTAIDGGADGLALVRDCLDVIRRHLVPAGSAVLQVGPRGQAHQVRDLVGPDDGLTVIAVREYADGALVHLDEVAAQPSAG